MTGNTSTSNPQQSTDDSKSSTISTNVSVTNEDHLSVPQKLYDDLVSLKNTFTNVMRDLDNAASSKTKSTDDIITGGDIICLSDEQVNKGMTNTKKDPLKTLFSQLITVVRPLCTPQFKLVDKQCKSTHDIPSLEDLVDKKLKDVHDTLKADLTGINTKLDVLSGSLDLQKRKFSGITNLGETSTPLRPTQPKSKLSIESIPVKHDECHVDENVDNFLTNNEYKEIEDMLSGSDFVFNEENGHSTLLFGSEQYRYSGSRGLKPSEMPAQIKSIMEKLNAEQRDNEELPLINSCLVNRFVGNKSLIKEHADDEPEIHPDSKIYTVSLGSMRRIKFRNLSTGEIHIHDAKPASLYTMSRRSQNFYYHEIEAEKEESDSIRYSLTFRSISWRNKNSTLLIGDSNTGKLRFGPEQGCFGKSLPGKKIYAPTIDNIDPLAAVGYSNVVILCGINDIKPRNLTEKTDIDFVCEKFKSKIKQIKTLCRGTKIVICPILPTRSPEINRKARYFNQFIWNDLVPNNWGISYVWGFDEFLDYMGNLNSDLAKPHDALHLNNIGARTLGRLIKRHFFPTPLASYVSNKTYAHAASGVNGGTAEPRSAGPA